MLDAEDQLFARDGELYMSNDNEQLYLAVELDSVMRTTQQSPAALTYALDPFTIDQKSFSSVSELEGEEPPISSLILAPPVKA